MNPAFDPELPIAIVGGGCSGTLAALQLLQAGARRLVLVERSGVFGRGLAYAHQDDNLLLNVPAGNMSAFPDAPGHFVDFCRGVDPALHAGSFVSRRLYGDYLQDLLEEGARGAALERVSGEVHALQREGNVFTLTLADGRRLAAARVVLALGHFGPRDPLPAPGLAAFGAHHAGAWDLAALDALPRALPVLVLGSGHTAIDVLFRLCSAAGARQVVLLSRRGLLPHGHRLRPQPPAVDGVPAWLEGVAPTVRALTRAVRREAARREASGDDWRDVVNELRPQTPALWQRLPPSERRRFIARVAPYWDVHRHRLAPVSERRLQRLLAGGQAEALAGRVQALMPAAQGVDVTLRLRGGTLQTRRFGAVVNATGPSGDLRRVDSPLLARLLREGLVRADDAGLGLQVDRDYRVIGADGRAVPGLFYLGPMLKARDWEAIAVPELRCHAQALARRVLAAAPLRPGV